MGRIADLEQERRDEALAHAEAVESDKRLDAAIEETRRGLEDAIEEYSQTVRDFAQRGERAVSKPYTYRLLKVADERYLNRGEPLPVDLAARLIELGIDINNL